MKYIGRGISKSCMSWYACCIVLISLFGCEYSNLLECQFCFLVHLLLSSIPQRTSGCLCWTRINKFKGRPQNSVRLVYHPVYCLENFAKLHFFCCTCFHFLKKHDFWGQNYTYFGTFAKLLSILKKKHAYFVWELDFFWHIITKLLTLPFRKAYFLWVYIP